jgi:hypothetical protein
MMSMTRHTTDAETLPPSAQERSRLIDIRHWRTISLEMVHSNSISWEKLCTEPMLAYCERFVILEESSRETDGRHSFASTANMYLAEGKSYILYNDGDVTLQTRHGITDRILCWELVSKRNSNWILHYVKSASAITDVPDGVSFPS